VQRQSEFNITEFVPLGSCSAFQGFDLRCIIRDAGYTIPSR
jgi:hypothetical protein